MTLLQVFISCPKNTEYLLEEELLSLHLKVTKVSPMGIYGEADLETIYNICLRSRIAVRVNIILFQGKVHNRDELLQLCSHYDWRKVFNVENSFAIDFHGSSDFIKNSMFGAQLIKDGIVDYFKQFAVRPNVDKKTPDIKIQAFLKKNNLSVSLDLLGYSLHKRGYRQSAGTAPIKENVAAAILARLKWKELAAAGHSLVDPFCGSATFLIEAAMIAANIAPGLITLEKAKICWLEHDEALWQQAIKKAKEEVKAIDNEIVGYDVSPKMLSIAKDNIASAKLQDLIKIKQQAIKDFTAIPGPGLLVCNPPYGDRMQDIEALLPVYKDIGKALYEHCQGFKAGILTTKPELARAISLRIDKKYTFYNGALEAVLYCLNVDSENKFRDSNEVSFNKYQEALLNRLSKNKKKLAKWLKRTNHSCYRLYDADLPEYAFAIDVYNDWVHMQEYAPPKSIPEAKAKRRLQDMLHVLPHALGIPKEHIVVKQRKRQRGTDQYNAFDRKNKHLIVTEDNVKFKVNLFDYLDTGLFLDHRALRLAIAQQAKGRLFLNCFCYTAAFSVHAAMHGAKTYNVDLSNTYLNWAKDNFKLNKIDINRHHFIQANCLKWLRESNKKFDIILLDPPSFSNSKRMEETFDVQRDHVELIDAAMRLLTKSGVLYFSNNFKKFKIADEICNKYKVVDITKNTLDLDFKREKHYHKCFEISWKQ